MRTINLPLIAAFASVVKTNGYTQPQQCRTSFTSSATKFRVSQSQSTPFAISSFRQNHASSRLQMSDFGSAMPEKPKLTTEQKLIDAADKFINDFSAKLSEGVPPPPELDALIEARKTSNDKQSLSKGIYELMIEQGMLYDIDPTTGMLSPTLFDIKANLDVPEVKSEFDYLYKYGMSLISNELIEVDVVKNIVVKRLIERTGLSPEEFDKWLGY
eukprot:CAMPEP_0171293256 /NCGR_PEP_ID=MMETSP0816-20121228/1436_1 /TAXON_ID=420281 /ORGANISM="Proboscia inermis, Strain CCAP1064/1" /LENGTH=214 /DNA_ID=CAMNT_0011763889 /DNA_START=25 /DNA_END=669 /DNA_ORIENTATION=-